MIGEDLGLDEKLRILSDAAKYDAACTSSGVGRGGRDGSLGNSCAAGICHSFAADGRCISLLKILQTNECVYDCTYCINRRSNDVERAAFTPEEVCALTMEFYRRNYIEGLFLSSGVRHSPDYTMEQMYHTLWKLRNEHRFNGYIHVKAIPGASQELVDAMGFLADRMSINLELPTAEGLRALAPAKTREKILAPMRRVADGIAAGAQGQGLPTGGIGGAVPGAGFGGGRKQGAFVPAGQSTQIIVGATPESDYHMIHVAEALYRKYDLKRVFYSAFVRVNDDSLLPMLPGGPPLLREHRLYQADWLMRYYGFSAGELLDEEKPNFNVLLDPKCDWALRNMTGGAGFFPSRGLRSGGSGADMAGSGGYVHGGHGMGVGANAASRFVGFAGDGPGGFAPHGRIGFARRMDGGVDGPASDAGTGFSRVVKDPWARGAGGRNGFLDYGTPGAADGGIITTQGAYMSTRMRMMGAALDADSTGSIFPVEVNRADYFTLLRVPGMGVKSAKRIVAARRGATLDFPDLKKLGVVLKRAVYFITCSGRTMFPFPMDPDYIARCLIGEESRRNWQIENRDTFRQLSLFDDGWLSPPPSAHDSLSALTGML